MPDCLTCDNADQAPLSMPGLMRCTVETGPYHWPGSACTAGRYVPSMQGDDDRGEYEAVLIYRGCTDTEARGRTLDAEAAWYAVGRESRDIRVQAFRERCSDMGAEWSNDMRERIERCKAK